jgi:DNA invertase Pin-like site-specific DNA recombinase
MNYVTYYRVSTKAQGYSGLGIEAQQDAVASLLRSRGGRELASFTEVESGKRSDNRPQLQAALLRCRQARATLLVAKLDRLSRNAVFLLTLRDSGQRFIAADMPDANELTVGVLALVAQHEREMISARTKAALAAAKARGRKLGNPQHLVHSRATATHASAANAQKARKRAGDLLPVIEDAMANGTTSLRGLADHLNDLLIPAPLGGLWFPGTVRRLLKMLGE